MAKKKIGRNAPCPCGSGKKYKKCCLEQDKQREHEELQQKQAAQELAQQRNWNPFAEPPDPEDLELFEDDPTVIRQHDAWEDDEYDEDWEDGGEREEPVDNAVERWEPPVIQQIPKHDTPLSKEEIVLVDAWWDGYKKLNDATERFRYMEALFVNQPDLSPKVDWPDAAFDLVHDYADTGMRAEYIALLMRIRRDWPELYTPDFAYFDRDIVFSLVIGGRQEELPEFLSLFRQYPSHDGDNLFDVIRFLQLTNSQEVLIPFLRDICHEVCYSPKIMSGADILSPVVMSYCMPYLRPDVSDVELAELAVQLQTIKGPVNEEYFKPEFLKEQIHFIVGDFTAWDIADCATNQDVYTRYTRICQNFMGFLHREKGKGWLMADFLRELMLEYFERAIPEGKRPKAAFGMFTRNKVKRMLDKLGSDMMFIYPSRLFGAVNAVYYFAEYLAATASVSEEQAQEIQDWCRELFTANYAHLAGEYFSVKAFEQFPL